MLSSRLLIGGKWQEAETGETIAMFSPSNGKEIGAIASGSSGDVNRAVASARRAFEGTWGNLPAFERGRLMNRLGLLILEHHEEPGSD
ncbi:aldehyde dehydrogenase family protein [Devosia algicola]|uniref:aldehyde dehydrogenase family protein n=1 Tax=Devosia algicola TaxID=3026418 RepID=UPI00389915A6